MIISSLTTKYLNFSNFVPSFAFGWVSSISQPSYEQPSSFNSDFAFTAITEKRTLITAFRTITSTTTYYIKKDTLEECIDDEESFYFDIANQLLYVHFNHLLKPDSEIVLISEQRNYTGATAQGVWYDENDFEYLPKLLTLPQIAIEADPLVYSKMAFQNISLDYDNTPDSTTSEFDSFIDSPIPGSESTLSYIPEAWFNREPLTVRSCVVTASTISSCVVTATEKVSCLLDTPMPKYYLYTGIVRGDALNLDTFTVNLIDKRSIETKKIPENRFETTTYPLLKDNVIDKIIPEGYGSVRGAECFCLTGTSGSGNQTYKFATDATAVTTVYVENDNVWEEVTPVSTDATNGEFVLSASDSLTSGGSPKKVKADVTLRNIKNPADIIADINDRYLGVEYDTTNYDTTKWTSEKAYLKDVGLLMSKGKEIFEWIEDLQNGSNYGFRYDISGNGKRFIKVDLLTRDSEYNIDWIDLLNNPTATRDFDQYASKVVVNYDKDYKDKEYFVKENTDFFNDAIKAYGYDKTYEIDSLLPSATDATEKALNIATAYNEVKPFFELETQLEDLLELDLYDFIDAELSEPDTISGWAGRDLWGTQKGKILSKVFDSATDTIIIKIQGGY